MRQHRVAVMTALVVCTGTVYAPTLAHATTSSTFYVNNQASGGCSDSTSNSSTRPYCTIQAAVNAAHAAGSTVSVAAGTYTPFTVTASGTSAAPITVKGAPPSAPAGPDTTMITSGTTAGIIVKGASYVNIDGFSVIESANLSGIIVANSSHVTVDNDEVEQQYFHSTGAAVSVSAGSSDVTISRNRIDASSSAGGILAADGSGDVITTNAVDNGHGVGIVLAGATSSAVTSNDVSIACGSAISVTAGSSGASVQNNVGVSNGFANTPNPDCTATAASERVLVVDALVDRRDHGGLQRLRHGVRFDP